MLGVARCPRRHRLVGAAGPLEGAPQGGQVVLVDELGMAVLEVGRLPSDDPRDRRADVPEMPVAVDGDDEVADILHERSEPALAGLERLHGDLALAHVVGNPLHAHGPALVVEDQRPAVLEPGVRPVGPAPPNHGGGGQVPRPFQRPEVIGMDERPPEVGLGIEGLRRDPEDGLCARGHVFALGLGEEPVPVAEDVP